ncbi:unnamed protein product, partial [Aphanomyces euteiches]
MRTFKEKLAHNILPQWEEHYINYSELKYLVKQIQRRASFIDMGESDYIVGSKTEKAHLLKTTSPTHFEQEFIAECEKVEVWYGSKLEEYNAQFDRLQKYDKPIAAHTPLTSKDDIRETQDSKGFLLEWYSIKRSYIDLYKMLRLLQNFAHVNYTGLRKILKKHKRKCGDQHENVNCALNNALHDFAFSHALPMKECILRVESYFTRTFHGNDRVLALAELDGWKDSTLNWQHFYSGLKMGAVIVLALWLVWDDVVLVWGKKSEALKLTQTKAYPFYRGMAIFIFFLWLWAGTLYTWQAARINYRYICELDPHVTPDYSQVLDDASHLSIVYFVNFILYAQIENQVLPENIPKGYFPLTFAVYLIFYFTSKDWGRHRRIALVLRDIVLPPIFPVSYFHTFAANYMTSATKMNQDIAWSVCYFSTGEFLDESTSTDICANNLYLTRVAVPLITTLPLWWRFVQSLRRVYDMKSWFPGVLNALKYAFSLLVSLFGILHSFYSPVQPSNTIQIVWIVLFVMSSLYNWLWDVIMDWGLGRPQYNFLGDWHMYSRRWIYYFAIVADLILIFSWSLALIPPMDNDAFTFMGLLLCVQPFT